MHDPERVLLLSGPSQVRLLRHILRAFLGATVMFCRLMRMSCFGGVSSASDVVSVSDSPVGNIQCVSDEQALSADHEYGQEGTGT